jgi:hypothetical protein
LVLAQVRSWTDDLQLGVAVVELVSLTHVLAPFVVGSFPAVSVVGARTVTADQRSVEGSLVASAVVGDGDARKGTVRWA